MKKIAVEKSLKNVKAYLEGQGYHVTEMENKQGDLENFDAIIVSGQNSNFLGIHNTTSKATVINAKGMSVEDIYEQLNNNLS